MTDQPGVRGGHSRFLIAASSAEDSERTIHMKTMVAIMISLCSTVVAQQFSSVPGQGRSMVVTKLGIVVAPQSIASQAGAHILEEGGNVVIAPIAANAVMGLAQPYVNGMGGDLFAIYYDA